jgi:hypothetical protein
VIFEATVVGMTAEERANHFPNPSTNPKSTDLDPTSQRHLGAREDSPAIIIIPAKTYGSTAVLPLALTMLTMANMTAGKKRKTKVFVKRWR